VVVQDDEVRIPLGSWSVRIAIDENVSGKERPLGRTPVPESPPPPSAPASVPPLALASDAASDPEDDAASLAPPPSLDPVSPAECEEPHAAVAASAAREASATSPGA